MKLIELGTATAATRGTPVGQYLDGVQGFKRIP